MSLHSTTFEYLKPTDEQSDWPVYESHKVVWAAKIVAVHDLEGIRTIMVRPENSLEVEPFHPTEPAMMLRAEVGGYAVLYPDGYKSISPAKAFEEGYTRI